MTYAIRHEHPSCQHPYTHVGSAPYCSQYRSLSGRTAVWKGRKKKYSLMAVWRSVCDQPMRPLPLSSSAICQARPSDDADIE